MDSRYLVLRDSVLERIAQDAGGDRGLTLILETPPGSVRVGIRDLELATVRGTFGCQHGVFFEGNARIGFATGLEMLQADPDAEVGVGRLEVEHIRHALRKSRRVHRLPEYGINVCASLRNIAVNTMYLCPSACAFIDERVTINSSYSTSADDPSKPLKAIALGDGATFAYEHIDASIPMENVGGIATKQHRFVELLKVPAVPLSELGIPFEPEIRALCAEIQEHYLRSSAVFDAISESTFEISSVKRTQDDSLVSIAEWVRRDRRIRLAVMNFVERAGIGNTLSCVWRRNYWDLCNGEDMGSLSAMATSLELVDYLGRPPGWLTEFCKKCRLSPETESRLKGELQRLEEMWTKSRRIVSERRDLLLPRGEHLAGDHLNCMPPQRRSSAFLGPKNDASADRKSRRRR